jgi:mRNA (guanine-N7-)-methyltransferase
MEYGLELLYRKGFKEVYEDESEDRELGMLAERMGVRSRDRAAPNNGCLVGGQEMVAASFYHAFAFYKT